MQTLSWASFHNTLPVLQVKYYNLFRKSCFIFQIYLIASNKYNKLPLRKREREKENKLKFYFVVAKFPPKSTKSFVRPDIVFQLKMNKFHHEKKKNYECDDFSWAPLISVFGILYSPFLRLNLLVQCMFFAFLFLRSISTASPSIARFTFFFR